MPFDVRRFQFLIGTPCECENITYTEEDTGRHVAVTVCCARCWECGMMALASESSRQRDEVFVSQLEMDWIVEAPTPPAP